MVIENLRGQKENCSLPTPIYNNAGRFSEDYGTGTMLTRVWFGPRTHRAFIETDSIWENRQTHGCVGKTITEIEHEELLRICDKFSISVPSAIPETEIS